MVKSRPWPFLTLKVDAPRLEQQRLIGHRSKAVVEELKAKYGDGRHFMKLLDEDQTLRILCPLVPCPQSLDCPHLPRGQLSASGCPLALRAPYWVLKRDQFIKPEDQTALWNAYHDLVSKYPNILKPPKVSDSSKNAARDNQQLNSEPESEPPVHHHPSARSSSHQPLHLGYWRRYSGHISLTADTLQHGDHERQLAIFAFLSLLGYILYKNRKKIQDMDGKHLHNSAEISALATSREFKSLGNPALDATPGHPLGLGLLGTTVAVATGYSEKYHIDYNDYNQGGCYTFSFSVSRPNSKCEMEIHFPQLHCRIPYKSGQLFAFQAGDLLHRVVPRGGEVANRADRLNFTIFTDRNSAKHIKAPIRKRLEPYVDVPQIRT